MELLEQTTQVERATVRAIAHDRARTIVHGIEFPSGDDRTRRSLHALRSLGHADLAKMVHLPKDFALTDAANAKDAMIVEALMEQ